MPKERYIFREAMKQLDQLKTQTTIKAYGRSPDPELTTKLFEHYLQNPRNHIFEQFLKVDEYEAKSSHSNQWNDDSCPSSPLEALRINRRLTTRRRYSSTIRERSTEELSPLAQECKKTVSSPLKCQTCKYYNHDTPEFLRCALNPGVTDSLNCTDYHSKPHNQPQQPMESTRSPQNALEFE